LPRRLEREFVSAQWQHRAMGLRERVVWLGWVRHSDRGAQCARGDNPQLL